MFNGILVRYGEIGTKGKNKEFFEKRLAENIKNALKRNEIPYINVHRLPGRVLVETFEIEKCEKVLKKIFGIRSFSPVVIANANLEEILEKVYKIIENANAKSFAVRVNNADNSLKENSQKLNEIIGERVVKKYGLKVNLEKPELLVGIELRRGMGYVFTEKFEGPGGLPVGSAGRAVCLLSGGIDSAVAAYFAMKRGLKAILLHFDGGKFFSNKEKITKIAEKLEEYNGKTKLIIYNYEDVLEKISEIKEKKYICVLCKRAMKKIAERVCTEEGAQCIVTGESLSQVASQTIENLNAEQYQIEKIILQPLIGFDKEEVIKIAKEIGTYEISIKNTGECRAKPRAPATRSKIKKIIEIEKDLKI